VAVSGDGQLALIGGPRDDDNAGAAWIFARTSSTWRQQGKKLTGGETTAKSVGWDVALSANGRMALIGSPGHAGGVFLFAHSGSRWVRRQRISRPGGGSGCSVSLSPSGNTAAIGTWTAASTTTTPDKGKAYVFTCSSFGCLVPGHELAVKRDTEVSDRYGRDVAVVDNRDAILVGAAGGPSLNKTGKPIQNGQAWVFLNWPFVESVLPSAGPPAGGTDVTITGENFTKVRAVSFGSTPAAQYTVDSSPKIRAVSPPGTGYVHVRVTTAIGISPELSGGWGGPYDGFRYLERPVVTAINPTSGPTAGGTQVTITGTNLAVSPTVRFGTVPAVSPSVGTAPGKPDVLSVTSPPGPAGTVDITVTTPGGTSATGPADRFTYVGPATEKLITFDDLTTGGPGGGAGSLVVVNSQYAGQSVTFNDVSASTTRREAPPCPTSPTRATSRWSNASGWSSVRHLSEPPSARRRSSCGSGSAFRSRSTNPSKSSSRPTPAAPWSVPRRPRFLPMPASRPFTRRSRCR